jgi:hypothetical protein
MERPNFPKAVSLREGRSDLLVAKHAFTGSANFVGCSSNKEELSARARDRDGEVDLCAVIRRLRRFNGEAQQKRESCVISKKPPEGSGGFSVSGSVKPCLVGPPASATEVGSVTCLIAVQVLILVSVLVSVRAVISAVRVIAAAWIRIVRLVLRYISAGLV